MPHRTILHSSSMISRLPSVAVVGAGSFGGILAASLASAKRCNLTVISRGATLESIQSNGLRVTLANGTKLSDMPVRAMSHDQAETAGHQNFVFVCSPAAQMAEAISSAAPLINEHTRLVPCQTGLPFWFFDGFDDRGREPTASAGQGLLNSVIGSSLSVQFERHFGAEGVHWMSTHSLRRSTMMIGAPTPGPHQEEALTQLKGLFADSKVPLSVNISKDIRKAVFNREFLAGSFELYSHEDNFATQTHQEVETSHFGNGKPFASDLLQLSSNHHMVHGQHKNMRR